MRNAGDVDRGDCTEDAESRAWNLRSNGRKDGVGLRAWVEEGGRLLGEEANEPYDETRELKYF